MILISQRPTTWLTVRYLDTRRGSLGTASDRGRRAIFSEAKLLVGLAGPNATTHPLPRSWAGSDREPQGGRAGLPRGVAAHPHCQCPTEAGDPDRKSTRLNS